MLTVLYFASVKEKAGCGEEVVPLPASVTDVMGLVGWLRQRGGGPAAALADLAAVRVAVNQEHARFDHPLTGDEEVAFFPPVTGGAP
ncbi:MAG: molybdopterin converting factor subunit 1 [Defluviicoccus sp.]